MMEQKSTKINPSSRFCSPFFFEFLRFNEVNEVFWSIPEAEPLLKGLHEDWNSAFPNLVFFGLLDSGVVTLQKIGTSPLVK